MAEPDFRSKARPTSVLLLEDDPGDAICLQEILSEEASRPFEVDHVTSLAEARARLAIGKYDVAIVDPPRKGLEPEVIEGLIAARPARLVYVSCDPDALRRDLKALTAGGFRLGALEAFACFPYTDHVESIALLS